MEPALMPWETPLRLWDFLDRVCAIFMVKLLNNFFITDLFNILRKLELGVFYFCWRKYDQAKTEGRPFSLSLELQSKAEYRHAQTFSAFCGRSIPEPIAKAFERPPAWGTLDFDNEVFQVDGISQKYLTAKIFFRGNKAKDLGWGDCLAMMAVLEKLQLYFYSELIDNLSNNFQKILERIALEEMLHGMQLEQELRIHFPHYKLLLIKWHLRKYCALLFLPFDVWRWKNESR